MTELVRIATIRTDGGTQSRAGLNEATVDEYAEAIEAGAKFPPMVVFYDGEHNWLADGFHRHAGYVKAGVEMVGADVRQGTVRDAILYSVGANATHGLPRTNADKRRAVETLLRDEEWSARSDNWIAKQCCVSQPFVGKLRSQLITVISCGEARLGQDGKVYATPTKKADKIDRAKRAIEQASAEAERFEQELESIHERAPDALSQALDPQRADPCLNVDAVPEPTDDEPFETDDPEEWDAGLAVEPIYETFERVMAEWPDDDPAYRMESALMRCLKRLEIRRERMQG